MTPQWPERFKGLAEDLGEVSVQDDKGEADGKNPTAETQVKTQAIKFPGGHSRASEHLLLVTEERKQRMDRRRRNK